MEYKFHLGKKQAETLQKSLGKVILHHQMIKILSFKRVDHISAPYHKSYYRDEHRKNHNFKFIGNDIEYNIEVEMRFDIKDSWSHNQCFYEANPYKFSYTITECN